MINTFTHYEENLKPLTFERIIEIMDTVKPVEFLAFTVNPRTKVQLKNEIPELPEHRGDLLFVSVRVYTVQNQEKDVIYWKDEKLLKAYLKINDAE